MLTEERHALILKRLVDHGVIKSQDLMTELNCSESTIRRDLALLEETGELIRIHGGAKRNFHLDEEQDMNEKTFKNVQEKNLIAQLAASLVKEKDTIYIDAGSTTLAMIPFLTQKGITVVTNGVQHASLLADHKINTILIGGNLKNSTKAIVGSTSLAEIERYQFSKTFLGMNGVHPDFGFTTPDPEEAALKAAALKKGFDIYVLLDETKFDKVNFTKVAEIDQATIVTQKLDHQKYPTYFEKTTILEVRI
ncbi:DeoR/GlpR transcriptional regulator [Carnobacterium divergens]|uniref:DeoR/GlpR family DNA-binding transcription regulator n=1 Tax=Carnobacterium divergens TaxID=2748 RepID=A0A2R7ZZK6_CARDV|nr:DeoR/GlpR family DNA-binding transcription regulator [Carnobacterium divergens]ANZ99754.1 DeoR family transcriptional regulator [Carnobacterium divergens]MCO6017971.1 DeoR/GlpR family DNA-binding transcription regulator [Carnobacterium divergens]MDT1957968.1 DeoR/GlpR family DNA-binding transcription regulator [Carnobacterium divergens]MDT1973971.1 DeoR/GlpR family DNA-binding transcription regulator [Carnobacterium divergens]MDT1995284.1 DeoR/GlpR family DNA-binding transcription regulator